MFSPKQIKARGKIAEQGVEKCKSQRKPGSIITSFGCDMVVVIVSHSSSDHLHETIVVRFGLTSPHVWKEKAKGVHEI